MVNIAVIMGGVSSEREVSLISGSAVVRSLKKLPCTVIKIDMDCNIGQHLSHAKPDLAFIALHGKHGEDGCIQGMLEIMNIPYTHSNVTASATAMDKHLTKQIAQYLGVNTPNWKLLSKEIILASNVLMYTPYIVKPTNEGSSINVYLFDKEHSFTAKNYPFNGPAIVEQYIPGREIHSAVINGKASGIIEIDSKLEPFYNYKSKYEPGASRHMLPPNISDTITKQIMQQTQVIHNHLNCKGITRADFIYNDETDEVFFLELNTHPGLTPTSLVPEIANFYLNMDFDQLIHSIVSETITYYGINAPDFTLHNAKESL